MHFFRIAEVWHLTIAEQQNLLGGVAKQTIYSWKARPQEARLTGDQLDPEIVKGFDTSMS